MFLATRAAPIFFARNRLSLVYVRPTSARSSQLSTGRFTAPGTWSSSNSDCDLTSINSSNSASRTSMRDWGRKAMLHIYPGIPVRETAPASFFPCPAAHVAEYCTSGPVAQQDRATAS